MGTVHLERLLFRRTLRFSSNFGLSPFFIDLSSPNFVILSIPDKFRYFPHFSLSFANLSSFADFSHFSLEIFTIHQFPVVGLKLFHRFDSFFRSQRAFRHFTIFSDNRHFLSIAIETINATQCTLHACSMCRQATMHVHPSFTHKHTQHTKQNKTKQKCL